jgi:DNA-binding SARP family transcriptional activator
MTTQPTAHPVRLHLHGVAGWRHGEQPLQPLERKHAALLVYLWRAGPTPRAQLAALLWPEASDERARGNLRQRLLKLRKEAGDLVQDQSGRLALGATVTVEPADAATAELLQGHPFDDCETFARWLEGQREADRERRKRDWLATVREAARSQRLDDALYAADQLLQTDRESEEAFRVLMEVYYLRGDHAAAISAWDRCREMLRQLYGVAPSAATMSLGQTILDAARQASETSDGADVGSEAAASGAIGQPARGVQAPTGTPPSGGGVAPSPTPSVTLPATVLRPPRLVGRDAALQALVDGWHAGHVLVVAAAAGVGKSRLLADWQAGLGPCAAAAARPGDAVLPYASISRLLLSAVDRFAPALDSEHALRAARVLPRLATLAGVQVTPVHSDYERTQGLLALARLLGDCVQLGCTAFVLDDLQFADPASIAALRVLAEPGEPNAGAGGGLRFALAMRPDEIGPETTALITALAATGRCTRQDLALLSEADVVVLFSSLGLPATLDTRTWAARIWRQVGGNPAFLLESVKLLLTNRLGSGPADGTLPLPPGIEAIIQRRLELLSPRARHVAQLAAIAGSGYSVALAASALACAPLELSEPLRELELRQVFYGRQFVHDVIATVTARSVPATVADFMHRFIAEHLTLHGGDAAHIGEHWAACQAWREAGAAFMQAADAAGRAALANEQAGLLDRAIAAFEHSPATHDQLFDAIERRTDVYESQGHDAMRDQFIGRLKALARTEVQHLRAQVMHDGLQTNLGRPVDEAKSRAAIDRLLVLGAPEQAWYFARMLGWQLAMNNRAEEGLALLQRHEPWIETEASDEHRGEYRLARANIRGLGDQLDQAIAEGRQALPVLVAANDWFNALPAMSNIGVFHYWRGEYAQAHEVLTQARAHRERLYGSSGGGHKIDVHLGAVLYELGQDRAAQSMLEGALATISHFPDNAYRRLECLLIHNHLAQMYIARGRADEAAAVLAEEAGGVADRFYGRRLTLRLRWQRLFGRPDPALVVELQALVARLDSPFNRTLCELELARAQPPDEVLALCGRLQTLPAMLQRPGLQLHAAVLAAQAAQAAGDAALALQTVRRARQLQATWAPFDMTANEADAVLASVAAPATC